MVRAPPSNVCEAEVAVGVRAVIAEVMVSEYSYPSEKNSILNGTDLAKNRKSSILGTLTNELDMTKFHLHTTNRKSEKWNADTLCIRN